MMLCRINRITKACAVEHAHEASGCLVCAKVIVELDKVEGGTVMTTAAALHDQGLGSEFGFLR